MTGVIYIYTLSHPVTGDVRYVGKTTNLKKRMENHIWKANAFMGSRKLYNWIQSLLRNGQRPIMKKIEDCSPENWASREIFWIAYYSSQCFNLCNLTDGGDSNNGYKATEETKKLQSDMQRKRHALRPTTEKTKSAIAKSLSKPIKCLTDNIVYPSVKDASRASGVSQTTFHRKLHKGEKINNKLYEFSNN